MHEVLHVVLQHWFRRGERDREKFNIGCDIVVNSNIFLTEDSNLKAISLKKYGVSIHRAPNGKEGYNYTAEQIYEMFPKSFLSVSGVGGGEHGKGDQSDDGQGGDGQNGNKKGDNGQGDGQNQTNENNTLWDDHTK